MEALSQAFESLVKQISI